MENQKDKPKVSILIVTYNRAHMLEESLERVLKQTYQDYKVVVVDNGSTDNTPEVLEKFRGRDKIEIHTLPQNRGCSGGYNHALDIVDTEWFATMADDDVLLENALEILMRIPEEVDSTVNAVTGNCLSPNGEFTGKGVDKDQYLPLETIVNKCSGEFWGVTKTELLGELRFNEKLLGNENAMWYQVDEVANRYYVHQPMQIFNQDHGPTETNLNSLKDISRKVKIYRELQYETRYWEILKKYHVQKFQKRCFKGWFFLTLDNDREGARKYLEMLYSSTPSLKIKLTQKGLSVLGHRMMKIAYKAFPV